MKRFSTPLLSKGEGDAISNEQRQDMNRQARVEKRKQFLMTERIVPNLNEQNCIARDKMIRLEEEAHIYYVGKQAMSVSVTRLIDFFTGGFDPEVVVNRMFRYTNSSTNWKLNSKNSSYAGMTKSEVLDKWDYAATYGTTLHGYIEKYLLDYPKFAHETGRSVRFVRLTHPDGVGGDQVAPEYLKPLRQFLNWEISFNVKGWRPFYSERIVFITGEYSFSLAGSVDALYVREDENGKKEYCIIDWKTSKGELDKKNAPKGNYPFQDNKINKLFKYKVQLNIYKYLLQKFYGMDNIVKGIVLQLSPTNDQYIAYDVEFDIDVPKLFDIYDNHVQMKEMSQRFDGVGIRDGEKLSFPREFFPTTRSPLRYQNEREYQNAS